MFIADNLFLNKNINHVLYNKQSDYMAKVHKIEIHGFKSFNRQTVIPLFQGFNAIIGPNGSGKSNILDAICFVLGRTSKTLRAGRMDHVIFNGGHGRKPADRAQVSIYFDNTDRAIPIEDDIAKVTRKVNRRGVSTYKLNDRNVTRNKILEILSLAQIDPDGHNIIQQGDINKLIEMKPRERREIIDEISGIKEYTTKKEKAISELGKAEAKLNEANIIAGEKKEFLDKLKAEKENAEHYQNTEKKAGWLKACIAHTRVKGVEETFENINRNLKLKEQENGKLQKNVSGSDSGLDKIEREIEKIGEQINKKSINTELREKIEQINLRAAKRETEIEGKRRELVRVEELISKMTAIKVGGDVRNRAVQSIIDSGIEGVKGTLSALSSVGSQFEVAVEVALGGRLNDIIVDSENTAVTCINYLKNNNLGRARFLPLDRIVPHSFSAKAEIAAKMSGIIDFAINLIEFDRQYETAFRYVLRDTLVAESVEAARKIKGLRVVTLDGDIFEAGGAILGGSYVKKGGKVRIADLTDVKEHQRAKNKLLNEIEKLKDEIGQLNTLLDEKRKNSQKETENVQKMEKEKHGLEDKLEKTKKGRKVNYEQFLILEGEINSMKLRQARLEAELENLMIDYEKYRNRDDLERGDVDDMKNELTKTQRELHSLGPINMKSIGEYEEYNKGYTELKEKIDKLKNEEGSILDMIKQIDEKRKLVFNTTLETISSAFAQVFSDLTNGEGELMLEEDDIESGLLINARPGGKRLLSIDSLSGGEKTLTALAFLFAIQQYRPAPFYILDEIDAALDKENSEKIGNLILKYGDRAQFLLITHNDATAQKAERIYGVSMQKGTSQILGVELEENN